MLGALVGFAMMGPGPVAAVDNERHADAPPSLPATSEWKTYNGPYAGQRFSELAQIDEHTAGELTESCRVHAGELGPFQPGPILADNMLFITTSHSTIALNPVNCDILWKSIYAPEQSEPWTANRGLAYWQGKVFRGTPDARLIAYKAATGELLWKTVVGDGERGELLSSAPLAWNGLVFSGVSGGDFGIKGRMLAFDADTGKQVWQFNLIPHGGEPGAETWPLESSEHGGGGTWSSYALDPQTAEIFVPVDNPAPSFSRDARLGDNLYTGSLVVLDALRGKLKWYVQLRPNDDHDYGISSPPMLFSLKDGRAVVALGSKDGHVYVIDRKTHRLLYKTAVVKLKNFFAAATTDGLEICPGTLGGIEWNGPALDRNNDSLVVGANDWCSELKSLPQDYTAGQLFMRGTAKMLGSPTGTISSLDAKNGKIRWQFRAPNGVVAAITPTAGGVIFGGDLAGNFYVLRSSDGQVLKQIATGGALAGGVITYAVQGTQYVAVASGNVSRATFGVVGTPSLIIYRLRN